jgi:hypothetical protein
MLVARGAQAVGVDAGRPLLEITNKSSSSKPTEGRAEIRLRGKEGWFAGANVHIGCGLGRVGFERNTDHSLHPMYS